jgi:demethylmenaquinone methyltransferase / 2-methoxy-6-polyprenyl-1,4-benzoquinol methylase
MTKKAAAHWSAANFAIKPKNHRKKKMTNYHKNDPHSIQKMFGSIAKRYDKANAILSMQLHKRWNSQLINQVTHNQDAMTLLDLCCGTGDIAFGYLKKSSTPKSAILIDFCPEMLECAKDKAAHLNLNHHQIKYIQADVQKIPLENNLVHMATMAYGIRNVKNPLECFQEVHRILKPEGIFGILELTKPTYPLIRMGHRLYLRLIMPLLGKWITSNREAYQYLCSSIDQFAAPAELEKQLLAAGFKHTTKTPLACGIATIVLAQKA